MPYPTAGLSDEIKNKDILIKDIKKEILSFTSGETIKTTLITEEKGKDVKYYFFDKKKAGGSTVAQTRFIALNVHKGDTIAVGYKDEPYSFIGQKDGKEITGYRHRIINIELSPDSGRETVDTSALDNA